MPVVLTAEWGMDCAMDPDSILLMFASSFYRPPLTIQPSCPGLAQEMTASFMVRALRESNNPPNGKVNLTKTKKVGQIKTSVKDMFIILTSRRLWTKNLCHQAKQSVLSTVIFFDSCVKLWGITLNFGIMTTYHCTLTLPCPTLGFLTNINITVILHLPHCLT